MQTITLAIAPLFLLNGLATQFRAGLARQLRFASLGLSDLVAQALSACVTVALALAGAGVCRDYAHLTVALLRARDVPARLV